MPKRPAWPCATPYVSVVSHLILDRIQTVRPRATHFQELEGVRRLVESLPNQVTTFFPSVLSALALSDSDSSSGLIMVELKVHQTLIITLVWIHAVYTNQDLIAFRGNFLRSLDMLRQIQIHCLEVRTRMPERLRFPLPRELHFSAARQYAHPWPCWNWKPCPCWWWTRWKRGRGRSKWDSTLCHHADLLFL
jgi:hypothetical protein